MPTMRFKTSLDEELKHGFSGHGEPPQIVFRRWIMKNTASPSIFTLLGFGYSVIVLGVYQLWNLHELAGAAVYGVLVGAIAEFVGGMWFLARGEVYVGSVVSTFGAWLFGYYAMVTHGVKMDLFHPWAAGIFCLALVPPVFMLMMPALRLGLPALASTFILLIGVLVFLGLGSLTETFRDVFRVLSGICSLASGIFLWFLAWRDIKRLYQCEKT